MKRAGDKLERMLMKSDPFEGKDCGRDNCALCRNKGNNKSCNRRSLVYRASCQLCQHLREEEVQDAKDRGKQTADQRLRKPNT